MSMMIALRTIGVASAVARSEVVSCSSVKIGRKLLGFAVAKSLFSPLR